MKKSALRRPARQESAQKISQLHYKKRKEISQMIKAETINGSVQSTIVGSGIEIIAELCVVMANVHQKNTKELGAETANDMLRAIFLTAVELAEEEQD